MLFMWRKGEYFSSGEWIAVRAKSIKEAREKIIEYFDFYGYDDIEMREHIMMEEPEDIEFFDVASWFEGE